MEKNMKYFNWSFFIFYSDEPENKYDEFDDTPSSKYSYKDDDEEFTSVERTHTTRTEKITTNRRTRSVGKKLDLGASSSLGKDKSDTTVIKFMSKSCNGCFEGINV